MRLLLTRFGASGLDKHKLITLIDTETGEIPFIDIVGDLGKNHYIATGVTYSGNWLCIGANSVENSNSYMLLFNFITGTVRTVLLPLSYNIFDIVSVFPGQLYLNSEGTHSLNNISFSPDTGDLKSDTIHYKLSPHQTLFSSLCSHQMRWYGTTVDSVIELSNNRVIHSGLTIPHSIFFNSYERLCFLELNKFYCGDDLFYFNKPVSSVYEDTTSAGYWLCSDEGLFLIDYDGKLIEDTFLSIGDTPVFKIVEVRGCLNEAF